MASKMNISVAEGIEKYIVGRDDDTVCSENTGPQIGVFPLVGFEGTRDHGHRDVEMGLDDGLLLVAESDRRREEPADLRTEKSVCATVSRRRAGQCTLHKRRRRTAIEHSLAASYGERSGENPEI